MILLSPKYDLKKCSQHLKLLKVEIHTVFQKSYFDFLLEDKVIFTVSKNSTMGFLDLELTSNWIEMFPNVSVTCEIENIIAQGNSHKYTREFLHFSLEGKRETTRKEMQITEAIVSEVNKFFGEMNNLS